MVRSAHVEHLHRRQPTMIDSLRQPQAPQRGDALGSRCRAAGEQHRPVLARPAQRDGARVVARVALVLVGRVVLLVDHDQPDVGQRSEHSRARAHADAGLAASQSQPFVVALALAERRMQHRDRVPEARPEPGQRLRRQPDLGYQDDRAAPCGERGLHRAQIHLGLARAGHSVQQEPPVPIRSTPPLDCREHLVERLLLEVGQRRRRSGPQTDVDADGAPGAAAQPQRHQASTLEPPQRRRSQRGGDGRATVPQRLEQGALALVEGSIAAQGLCAAAGQLGDQHPPARRPRSPSPAPAAARATAPASSSTRAPSTGPASPGPPAVRPRSPRRARSVAPARARRHWPSRPPRRAFAAARTGRAAAIRHGHAS